MGEEFLGLKCWIWRFPLCSMACLAPGAQGAGLAKRLAAGAQGAMAYMQAGREEVGWHLGCHKLHVLPESRALGATTWWFDLILKLNCFLIWLVL